jgi:membrane protein required for colicin V production
MDIGSWSFGGFDVVVFIILGFSGILSFARGFSRELISILALLIGLAAALFVYGRYRVDAQNFIQPTWLADAALFIGVFLLIYLIVTFIMRGWAKSIRGRKPGPFDRLLGLVFGIARGALLASLIVLVFFMPPKEGDIPVDEDDRAEWMIDSHTYPYLVQIAEAFEKIPFIKAKELAEDIIVEGEESDILPDIPTEDTEPVADPDE